MNTTNTQVDHGELQGTLREANRLWRRAGVRGSDRKMMLSELEAEIDGALRDGHDASAVLGEDSSRTLRQWADERGLCGRALRLELVVPAVVLGAAAGLAVILVAVFAGFAGRPTVDLGPLVLPMYASSGAFAYLCALLFVWITLRRDPRASSTLRWLSVLLPAGAVLSIGAGMAIAWWRNFNPTPIVLAVVVGVVIVVLGTTAGIARHSAVTGTRPETI
ncbi:lysine exporter LysO family protein [Rhodococcus sp. Q]|uniref:lysine exporter LysO family protein n=1 Tax=Rhodococcus sp. Q TaxID=2502252 RepID=UPI0010F47FF7|nr:lysine exporter LysO family protein [Rhodococcus sp. Q]